MERDRSDPEPDVEETAFHAWRKHEQAVEAFNSAGEAEEFQAVGVHCRESLIALANEMAQVLDVKEFNPPKSSDFKGWAALAAETWVTARRFRAYLKSLADHAWGLSVWLQHYSNATPWDAELVLEATKNVVERYGIARLRHERGEPARCPRCASYRVETDGDIEREHDPHIQWTEQVCASCEYRWDHHFIQMVPGQG